MTPKQDSILLQDISFNWLIEARGKLTTIQIECPDIIKMPTTYLSTENEELGTN